LLLVVAAPGVSDADTPLLLLDQNIRAAIAGEMKRLGYVESAENPDLHIAYDTAREQKVESNPVRVGIGKGSLEPAAVTAAVATAMRDFPSRPAP
jgi:hypothetical protein